jgi:hypothetical protein
MAKPSIHRDQINGREEGEREGYQGPMGNVCAVDEDVKKPPKALVCMLPIQ